MPGEIDVETTDGIIRGTPISIPNSSKQGYGFFGVPYAAPPVGNLRFAAPQPVEPWPGVRNATVYGNYTSCFLRIVYNLYTVNPGSPALQLTLYMDTL